MQNDREITIKKLVSNAKAILTNQIGLPLGVRRMTRIQTSIFPPLTNIDLKVFDDIDFKIKNCPIGTDRLLWDKNALMKQDELIYEVLASYRNGIINKCFEIIELLDNKDIDGWTASKNTPRSS
jgi:hypothetical protein